MGRDLWGTKRTEFVGVDKEARPRQYEKGNGWCLFGGGTGKSENGGG